MGIHVPQCVTVNADTSSMHITHWKFPNLTRLSTFGAKNSSGTSSAFDKSILSWLSISTFRGESKPLKMELVSSMVSLLLFVGRLDDCEVRRFFVPSELLRVAVVAVLFLVLGATGNDRSIPELLLSSGSSLVRSTIPPRLPLLERRSVAGMASPISSGFGRREDGVREFGRRGLLFSGGSEGEEKSVAKAER